MIADDENPIPAFVLQATAITAPTAQLLVTLAYTPPRQTNIGSQTLTITSTDVTDATYTADLSSFSSIRDLLSDIVTRATFRTVQLQATFITNPLRTNSPTELLAGQYLLSVAPQRFYTRHMLSDEDIQDELDGATFEHNNNYVIDLSQATSTIPGPNGATYPYPQVSTYPYSGLGTSIKYTVPTNEQYFISMLCASHCLEEIAIRYAKLPTINTDGAIINRNDVLDKLRQSAQEMAERYTTAYEKSGLSFQVTDLNRISGTFGTLTQTPEYYPGRGTGVGGLRWLSSLIPNVVQPVTQQDAHAPYNTNITSRVTSRLT